MSTKENLYLNISNEKKIINQIKKEHYDAVYCFELKSSFAQFYQNTGSEIFQLGHTDKIINYAQRCLELVWGPVDSNNKHEWIWLPVTDSARQKTNKMLEDVGIKNETPVVGFHPSFSGLRKSWFRSQGHREEKEWPVEYFGALAIALDKHARDKQLDLAIIMDLIEEDRELGEAIVKASNGTVKLLIPPLDFERYKATLERMNVLVAPNTGPMHIAGAVGTNLVALFGGLDPADSAAYVDPEKIVAISPESREENKTSIAAIHPDVVFAACQKFI